MYILIIHLIYFIYYIFNISSGATETWRWVPGDHTAVEKETDFFMEYKNEIIEIIQTKYFFYFTSF